MQDEIFKGKKIVIGITGGIAGYKSIDLIRQLRILGAEVHVIMTEHSTHLVDKQDFEKISGNVVQTSLFQPKINYADYIRKNKKIKHISLADIADVFIICPATANIIGKIAGGIADDLLTTSVMATNSPVLLCPAMNVKMYKNPIVQENVRKLRKLNYHFVEPEYGELACGYMGFGRLAGLDKIIRRIALLVKKIDFSGKKILVTAGATYEKIDPVRVITNKSSGKMGIRISEQAYLRGAEVILLRASNSIVPDYNINEESFDTVYDLQNKIAKHIKNSDIVIHCAAVSDFTVLKISDKKIKSSQAVNLELTPATKIFENLKTLKPNIFLLGFKAEHDVSKKELIESAYKILKKADADLVVANDVSKIGVGFDVDTNEVYVVDKNENVNRIGLADKRIIADKILDLVLEKMDRQFLI